MAIDTALLGKIISRISYNGDHWILNQRSPQVRYNGKEYRVIRIFWVLHIGPLADNAKLIRTCGVDGCVNPAHHRCETHTNTTYQPALRKSRAKPRRAIDKVRSLARKCGFELVQAGLGSWSVERKTAY